MLISYIRSSYLNSLEFCEQQTFLNYNLGIPKSSGIKASMGTCTHKVLECLAILKKEYQKNPEAESIGFTDNAVGEFSIKTSDLGSKAVIDSLINRAFEYYSLKEGNNFNKKQFLEIENWVYTPIWYKDGLFDPRKRLIVDAEPHFEFEIDKEWAKYNYKLKNNTMVGNLCIKGTIDLVTKLDDETIEIIDYKTGQRKNWATGKPKDYDSLCTDQQLMFYFYAASKMYPWAKNIVVTIYFIRDGGPFTIIFDEETKTKMEDILKKKFEYVKKVKLPKMVSHSQTDFRCTKICDYYKNKWPGTEINQCKFIHEKIKKHGIDYVQENFQHELHSISHYENPGS